MPDFLKTALLLCILNIPIVQASDCNNDQIVGMLGTLVSPTSIQAKLGYTKGDAWSQWLQWEIVGNSAYFRRTKGNVKIPFSHVPLSEVEIYTSGEVGRKLADELKAGDQLKVFKHPFNTNQEAAFHELPTKGNMNGHLTGSRSIVTHLGENPVSIKMPTDHPFGPSSSAFASESWKANLGVDARYGPAISTFYSGIESLNPNGLETVVLLKDVVGVYEKSSKNGVLIRDLSKMKKNHYYLPGHSLPYSGRIVAKKMNKNYTDFLKEAYGIPRAKADAELFLDYGATFLNPHGQNYLVEISPAGKLTGRLMVRDLTDSAISKTHLDFFKQQQFTNYPVLNIAEKNKKIQFKPHEDYLDQLTFRMEPNAEFNHAYYDGDFLLSAKEAQSLKATYEYTFIEVLNQKLKLNLGSLKEAEQFLNSKAGEKKILEYLIQHYRGKLK